MSLSWTWSEVSQGFTCTIKKEKSVVSKAEVPFWKVYLVYGRGQVKFLLLQRDCKTPRSWVKTTEAYDTNQLLQSLNHTVERQGVDNLCKGCMSFTVLFDPVFLWYSDFHLIYSDIFKGTNKTSSMTLPSMISFIYYHELRPFWYAHIPWGLFWLTEERNKIPYIINLYKA